MIGNWQALAVMFWTTHWRTVKISTRQIQKFRQATGHDDGHWNQNIYKIKCTERKLKVLEWNEILKDTWFTGRFLHISHSFSHSLILYFFLFFLSTTSRFIPETLNLLEWTILGLPLIKILAFLSITSNILCGPE